MLVTNEVCVQDVYTKPRLNSLDFDVTILNSANASNVIGTMVIEPTTIDSAAGTDAFGPNVLERRDTAIAALLGNPKVKASTAPSGMDMPTR